MFNSWPIHRCEFTHVKNPRHRSFGVTWRLQVQVWQGALAWSGSDRHSCCMLLLRCTSWQVDSWWPKPNQTHCDEICSCHPKVAKVPGRNKSITCSWMWLKSSQEGYHLGSVLRCFKIIGWLNASPALFSPLPYCILEAMVKWWLGCLQNSQSKLCQYISIDFKIHVFFSLERVKTPIGLEITGHSPVAP